MASEHKNPADYIRSALAFVLWLKIIKQDNTLYREFENDLDANKEARKTIQARVSELLQAYEAKLLVAMVKKEIQDLFKESRATKIGLIGAQVFGLTTSGFLLKYYFSLPSESKLPAGFILSLFGYILATFISVILAIWKKN